MVFSAFSKYREVASVTHLERGKPSYAGIAYTSSWITWKKYSQKQSMECQFLGAVKEIINDTRTRNAWRKYPTSWNGDNFLESAQARDRFDLVLGAEISQLLTRKYCPSALPLFPWISWTEAKQQLTSEGWSE